MKDLHIKLDNWSNKHLEDLQLDLRNIIECMIFDQDLDDEVLPDKLSKTIIIDAALELLWNCISNNESLTYCDQEDTYVRDVMAQAVYNRL